MSVPPALSDRWTPIFTFMGRSSLFGMETGALNLAEGLAFEPLDRETFESVCEAPILCVGAGGLGAALVGEGVEEDELARATRLDHRVGNRDRVDAVAIGALVRASVLRIRDFELDNAQLVLSALRRRLQGVETLRHGQIERVQCATIGSDDS